MMKFNRSGYGIKVVSQITIVLPVSKMGPIRTDPEGRKWVTVWGLRSQVEHELFCLGNIHGERVLTLNGHKARLDSVCTDGTARFELL